MSPARSIAPSVELAKQRLVHELEMYQIELEMQNAALRRSKGELETALAESRTEMERLKESMLTVQDRQALLGEMIDNITLQWRQPLDTLGLIIQKLPIFYGSSQFSREYLEKNAAQAMKLVQYMSRTIDDFRSCYRSEKKPVSFHLNQIVELTLSLVEQKFRDEKIGVALDLNGDPALTGCPSEYSQVLLNILMNARDALIKRNVCDPLIGVRSFTEKGNAVLTVTDNAGGIPRDILRRIFAPYFTTGPDQGAGIGLFISKAIIEGHMGGRLTASNVRGGARFRIEVRHGN